MTANHPLVLFDGVCNLCNSSVNFIIRKDKKALFRFVPSQSEKGKHLIDKHFRNFDLQTVVLIHNDTTYTKSDAFLKIMNKLGGFWKIFSILWIIPRPVRDFFYDLIARNRYRIFGKKDRCMIPSPEIKKRFIMK